MERPSAVIAIQDQQDVNNDIQQIKEIHQPKMYFRQDVCPAPIEEPKKKILKQLQVHSNGLSIAKVMNEPEYVYLARFSPLCKCIKYTILLYLCVAAITAAMLSINIHMCGLDASTHTLRMRKVTYPITATGLTAKQDVDGVYKTYDDLQDTVRFFDFYQSIFENDPDARFVLIDNTTQISIPDFPLALVFNFTYAPKIAISQLTFTTKNISSLVTEDNGAAFEIIIDNPKRTRMQISEPWFNFDHWYNVNERYNYLDKNSNTVGPYRSMLCGTNFEFRDNSSDRWHLADSRNKFSQIPLWFVDMRTLSQADVNCAGDYGVTFKLQQFFCFSPMLIRQVPNQIVNFTGIDIKSDIIIDFDTSINNEKIGYSVDHSDIYRIWLTKAGADGKVYLYADQVNVTFFIPMNKGVINFYGQSGNISTPEVPMELYQTQFQTLNEVGVNTILVIKVISLDKPYKPGNQTPDKITGLNSEGIYFGFDAAITFVFEDSTMKLSQVTTDDDGLTYQVKIIN
ncbi:Conserved_hypothetical protein [Hexamita inflata]|uniref:Uncharacterized protein n=1 Tax=Hexamita inflata TaxID=28002 RepID=A0AA86UZ05_9EUKA|nr:Conserved hypothetical protein [Hexamita inflata]